MKNKKSIWKPSDEIPDYVDVLVRFKPNKYTSNEIRICSVNIDKQFEFIGSLGIADKEKIKEYCPLTDFINYIDSFEKEIKDLRIRVERMEKLFCE